MMTFADLQDEVKRRATRDQSGTQYDTAVDNVINTALFRTAREALWRVLRRKSYITTVTSYTEGTGAVTNTEDSKDFTVTGATFLTDEVQIGRRIKFGGDGKIHVVRSFTSETEGTIDILYAGDDATDDSYEIYPQEEYNLPIQCSPTRSFLWHEDYGYPYMMEYVTDQDFYSRGLAPNETGTPQIYRMWTHNMVKAQPKAASVMRIASSVAGDTSIVVTVFGTVSGYPDFEAITTDSSDGTTAVSGSKSFSEVERIVKSATTTGRITVDADTATTTVAVIPANDITAGIMYSKVYFHPLPDSVFDINVQYYKDPYRLVGDNDVHELGQDFDEAIILLAVSKIKGETEIKDGTANFFSFWKDEIRSLRRTNADKIDWRPVLKRPEEGTSREARVHPYLLKRQVGANF